MPTRSITGQGQERPDGYGGRGTAYREALRERLARIAAADEQGRAEKLAALGGEFLQAAQRGNPATLEVFLHGGMPVNYQDPRTRQTALHTAAAAQAREAIRKLIAVPDCDFLIRDGQGRLASEHAYLFGRDPALARLLGNKERAQARAQGITLTRRAAASP